MTTFVKLFCFLVMVTLGARAGEHDETAQLLDDAHQKCQANPATFISTEDGRKLVNELPLDRSVWEGYIKCISENLHFQKANGEAFTEGIKDILNMVIKDEKKTDEFYNKCSVQKDESVETARAIYLCIHTMLHKYDIPH